MSDTANFRRYRCWLRSTPGMWAHYDGYVDVFSPDPDKNEVFNRAVRELARSSFPDRPSPGSWVLEKVEVLA